MPRCGRPWLYAHRGAPLERPENTLVSFERALELGVDAIETDAHMSRDGHVVLAHDPSAHRMTGTQARWQDLDLAAAQRLDAGWGFVASDGSRPFAGQGIQVPTLDEVLAALPTTPFNIDIKQAAPSMVEPVLALLRRHHAEDRVTLASFRWRTLLAVRRAGYAGLTALAQKELVAFLGLRPSLWRLLPFVGGAAQVPTHAGPIRLDTPRFIARCHAAGIRVDYWTIDDPAEATRLLDLGADGIMTDDPARIAPVFAARR